VFTLASNPGALGNSAQVYIGGVYQQRSTYTIAGTTLTFSAAPVAGTNNIEFVNFLTSNIGATSADLVTYTPSGSGAVARSASSKFGDVVSVKDFGAVGDGVTNDSAAFQAAVNAHESVFIPEGTYLLNSQVVLRANSRVFGAGMQATRILAPNVPAVYPQGIFHASSPNLATQLEGIELSDMEIEGFVATLGFSTQRPLVQFAGVKDCIVERVKFSGFRGDGIIVDSTNVHLAVRNNTNVTIQDCVFDGVNFDNRNGISIITGDGVNILNNTFRNVSRSDMPGPIDVEPNTVDEVVRNINIIGNRIESYNGTGAIQVVITAISSPRTTPVYGINIIGNFITGPQLSNALGIFVRPETSAGGLTASTDPHAVRIVGNTLISDASKQLIPIAVNYTRGFEISSNTVVNGNVVSLGDPTVAATTTFDGIVSDNVLVRTGNASGNLSIASAQNIKVMNNVFDRPGNGTALGAITIEGSGVTTASNNLSIFNNTFIKGASQTKTIRLLSHTLDPATNSAYGNRVIGGSLTSDFTADFGGGERYTGSSWTPAISVSGLTITYSSQTGSYIRIGNMVMATYFCQVTGISGTPSGGVSITGLPFASSISSVSAVWFSNLDLPAGYTDAIALTQGSSTTMTLRKMGDNQPDGSLDGTSITGTTVLSGTVLYQV
jgi:hypothetical protein